LAEYLRQCVELPAGPLDQRVVERLAALERAAKIERGEYGSRRRRGYDPGRVTER